MTAPHRTDVEVVFRAPAGTTRARPGAFLIAAPPLTETEREPLFADLASVPGNALELYQDRAQDLLVGRAGAPFAPMTIAQDSRLLYARVLAACAGRHLYRIWNYLPRINERTEGLEHYRAFCLGRSLAFEDALGAGFGRQVPAASAVGSEGDTLEVIFVAGRQAPRHVENPEQVPAYDYPAQYGPRPPSFARATVVGRGAATTVFVSGTAAIKGHASLAPDDVDGQIDAVLDNLRLVVGASGAEDALRQGDGWQRRFKVYLRRASDLPLAARRLQAELLTPRDAVVWLRTDLCRAELRIEVEATLARIA
jgi:hypothetical protein